MRTLSLWAASRVHLACTGAVINDVDSQIASLKSRLLSTPTSPVAIQITISGNDAGFSNEIENCIANNCTSRESTIANRIDALAPRLTSLYTKLKTEFPYADVFVAGYPVPIDPLGQNATPACIAITPAERQIMKRLVVRLNNLLNSSRTSALYTRGVFVDAQRMVAVFSGKGACTGPSWINGVSNPVVESYHPNEAGHLAYALEMNDQIADAAELN